MRNYLKEKGYNFQFDCNYYFHLTEKIIVTESVIQDYSKEQFLEKVNVANYSIVSIISSKKMDDRVVREIMERHHFNCDFENLYLDVCNFFT